MAGSVIPLVAPTITQQDQMGLWGKIMGTSRGRVSLLCDDESEVRAFEEEFAAFVGCAGGVAVNSGTNALLVALKVRFPFDHPTAIPSFTCRSILDAVKAAHLHEFLQDNHCDVASADFGMVDGGSSQNVVTHMFGVRNQLPAGMTNGSIGMLPTPKFTIEDITLSLGAVHSPEYAVCSFHRDKMITTGRGGMIVSQDPEFLARCRELAYYDQPTNGTYRPAFSFGMTAMQAALGRSQLRQLPGFIERRREIAARYTQAFSEVGIETPNRDVESVFFRYIIGTTQPAERVASLAGRGVECGRGVNPPLHRLLGLPNDQFPGAEECFSKLLSVPVHPGLTDSQVGFIIEQVKAVCAP